MNVFDAVHSIRSLYKLHVFFISNSFLGVNVRVAQQIYVSKAKSCLGVA